MSSSSVPQLILRRRPIPADQFVPTDEQRAIIAHRNSPLAVLGGPGTGKTATLIESVIARVNDGVDPNSILILTYGRESAANLRDQIAIRAGSTSFEPLSRTFHSLAFSILNEKSAPDDRPYILVSGAEQDAFIKDLLDNEHAKISWHPELERAVTTHGFVREIRDLISRATESDLTPRELIELGEKVGAPYWKGAAEFWSSYRHTMIMRDQSVEEGPIRIDTSENILLALDQLRRNVPLRENFRKRYTTILVDEFQESDASQRLLLKEIAGEDLIIFCDPDSAVGRFRGADPDGVLRWLTDQTQNELHLSEVMRSEAEIVKLGVEIASRFRSTSPTRKRTAAAQSTEAGGSEGERAPELTRAETIDASLFSSHGESANYIAYHLRKAHLEGGVPWSEMAVIVRTPGEQVAAILRAFSLHHIPVSAQAEALALSENPAIRPFLLAARFALRPDELAPKNWESIQELLLSEICGADALQIRHIRAALTKARTEDDLRSTTQMIIDAIADPITLDIDDSLIIPLIRLRELISLGKKSRHEISELLWAVWSNAKNYQGESIPELWRSRALKGGTRGAAADRDLDSVIQLFEAARRFSERMQGASPLQFLEQISGERLQSDAISFSAQREDAVSLLTVHGAKGLEWEIVALPGVQEGQWPNLKERGSLLGSERLSEHRRTGLTSRQELSASAASALVEDERRLWHVAVTRAKQHLLVTALSEEEVQPSRYFEELHEYIYGVGVEAGGKKELPRTLTEQALVATLRSRLMESTASASQESEESSDFFAALLKRLALEGVSAANPRSWLGVRNISTTEPLVEEGAQVFISPSGIQSFIDCELKWFLEKSGVQDGDTNYQLVGIAVHALAALKHERPELTEDEAITAIKEAWGIVGTNAGWVREFEQAKVIFMIERFFEWHAKNKRELIAVEQRFSYDEGRATVTGSVDRLEVTEDEKSLFIVDLKTGSTIPTADEVEEHRQLKAYQLAIEKAAWVAREDTNGNPLPLTIPDIEHAGGAELLYVAKQTDKNEALPQAALDSSPFKEELHKVAEGMSGSAFMAITNKQCERCSVRALCPVQSRGKSVIER